MGQPPIRRSVVLTNTTLKHSHLLQMLSKRSSGTCLHELSAVCAISGGGKRVNLYHESAPVLDGESFCLCCKSIIDSSRSAWNTQPSVSFSDLLIFSVMFWTLQAQIYLEKQTYQHSWGIFKSCFCPKATSNDIKTALSVSWIYSNVSACSNSYRKWSLRKEDVMFIMAAMYYFHIKTGNERDNYLRWLVQHMVFSFATTEAISVKNMTSTFSFLYLLKGRVGKFEKPARDR